MLKDKIAVITGGARGIGRAIADKMADNHAVIVILDMNEPEDIGNYTFFKCNVADYAETESVVKTILERFGRIDILVNNAGITRDKLTPQMTESEFDAVINVNLKGTFNMIRHTFRQFMKNKGGKIINMASVVGMMGNAGQTNYSASKAGVIGLTKSVAKELASRGINCNAIAPGYIDTSMTGALSETAQNEIKRLIPMGRIGKPDDVANLALFLASGYSDYITGEVIKIDGGMYI